MEGAEKAESNDIFFWILFKAFPCTTWCKSLMVSSLSSGPSGSLLRMVHTWMWVSWIHELIVADNDSLWFRLLLENLDIHVFNLCFAK